MESQLEPNSEIRELTGVAFKCRMLASAEDSAVKQQEPQIRAGHAGRFSDEPTRGKVGQRLRAAYRAVLIVVA